MRRSFVTGDVTSALPSKTANGAEEAMGPKCHWPEADHQAGCAPRASKSTPAAMRNVAAHAVRRGIRDLRPLTDLSCHVEIVSETCALHSTRTSEAGLQPHCGQHRIVQVVPAGVYPLDVTGKAQPGCDEVIVKRFDALLVSELQTGNADTVD